MSLSEAAPVTSTRELQIEASPEAVWSLLTEINNWPAWNTAVSRARLEGAVVPGSVFRWRSGGSSIVSTFKEIERPRRVSWTGRAFGVTAVHVWTIEANGIGVLVRTSESFGGWLVRLLRSSFQRLLDKSLEDALRSLKVAAERPRQGGSSAAA